MKVAQWMQATFDLTLEDSIIRYIFKECQVRRYCHEEMYIWVCSTFALGDSL